MHSINLPFWLAAACAAFPLVFIQLFLQRDGAAAAQPGAAPWSPSVLLRDRALLWFTCSGLLASFVGGAFASCLSQYVLVVASSDFAEKWWPWCCRSTPRWWLLCSTRLAGG